MDEGQLKNVMIFHLKNFNIDASRVIDENTIHKDVLNNKGIGTATPIRIYKSLIRWTIVNQELDDKKWPANWLEMSVKALASKLL